MARSFSSVRFLQFADVDLPHFHHRVHHSFGFLWVFVVQHLDQHGGRVTCQDKPNLSLSQPHADSSPPSAVSFCQKQSTSSCVSQYTTNDTDSLNLNCGPPLSAVNL